MVEADLSIARGLDYYTGTVFETRMAGFEQLGSICSGGRYDSLASDGKVELPGRGHLAGRHPAADATAAARSARRLAPGPVRGPGRAAGRGSRGLCDAIAEALRARGIAAEVAATAQKFGRQIRYAERRGIPYVWFPGDDGAHEVKDIRSGDQVPADPAAWMPPIEDLRPQVILAAAVQEQVVSP